MASREWYEAYEIAAAETTDRAAEQCARRRVGRDRDEDADEDADEA